MKNKPLSNCSHHERRSDLIRGLSSQSSNKCFKLEGKLRLRLFAVSTVQLLLLEGHNTLALILWPRLKNNRSEFSLIFLKYNFVHQLDCLPLHKPSSWTQVISQDEKKLLILDGAFRVYFDIVHVHLVHSGRGSRAEAIQ